MCPHDSCLYGLQASPSTNCSDVLARYNLSVTSQGVLPDPAAWQAATVATFIQQLNATTPSAGCPLSARASSILTQLLISVRAPAGNWSSGSQALPLIITNISGAALALGLQQQQQQQVQQPQPPAPVTSTTTTSTTTPPPSTSTTTTSSAPSYTWWWILLVFVGFGCGTLAGVAGTLWWAKRHIRNMAKVGKAVEGAGQPLLRLYEHWLGVCQVSEARVQHIYAGTSCQQQPPGQKGISTVVNTTWDVGF